MSNLKEEWASLMKLRGLGQAEQGKKEEIKTRIFNNFYSIRQDNIEKKPFEPEMRVKDDYEQLRKSFLNSIATETRAKTPEITKKFEFGLKHVNLPPSSNKLHRPDLKSEEIWTMKDSPFSKPTEEFLPDRFEQVSIADNQGGVEKTGKFSRFLNIFADFSPVTRYLCSLSEEEEEKYTKETASHESHIFSLFHLVNQEISYEDLSEIAWIKAANFTKGLIFRSQVSSVLNPPALIKDLSLNEKEKNSVSQCLSEPPIYLDNSIRKNVGIKTSNSTVPFVQPSNELDNLEKELMDMMDQIKVNYKSVSTEQKIKMLLKKTEDKIKNQPELARNTQVTAVIQFLQEYLKSQEKKQQPPSSKRVMQKKPTQKKSVTPVKSMKLNKVESNSSMGSNRSSKWIGGSKHQAEFEDDDWMSMQIEKKKPETRHEMLYKLSMKNSNK